ncbi:hypothetical protein AMS68_004041 [Peltaster fructicola]|uniref:Signal peptidase complex subunit 1 n=1 Tax=Peltaster fructicola TaxID=286661 RepID=A0A6H0XUW7_9PEZI|nr:hypothetical protein AMS68_004041 [Peltaster fructicola]
MEQLLEQARDVLEGTIDFKGQALTDFLTNALLTLVGIVAFLVGFVTQDIYKTLYVGLAGATLTVLLVVPPWPAFNSQPLRWLPARTGNRALHGVQIQVDGKRIQ